MAPRGNLIGQQLAKLFSKSGDDILEEVAQQAAKSGDDVSEAAVIANLQREAADAVPPVGSGKNLEALQRARVNAKDLDEVNAYPKNIQQDELANAGDFKLVGEPQTKNFTMVPEGSQVPAIRTNTIPEVIPGSAVPSNLPSIAVNQTDVSIPAIYRNIDESTISKMDPSLRGVAAALGLGGLGYGMMGGDKAPQGPIRPADVAAKEQAPELAIASPQPKSPATPSKVSVSANDLSKIAPVENTEASVSEEPDFVKMLEEAQAQSATNRRDANMTRYGELIGAGLGRITPEHEGSKIAREQAGQPVEDVKAKFGAHKEQQSYKKAKEELDDDAQKRDPNSEISKFYREKFGPFIPGITDKTSASHMEKALPQLTQLINTTEASDSRKERAALDREYLQENKQSQGLNKHIDTYNKSLQKNYDEFTKTQANISALDTIMSDAKNGVTPGAKDVSLLYSFISGLDPASTVREGEVQLSKGAMSLWGKIKSGTKQITGGDLLDQDTRDSFMEIMRAGAKAQENRFRKTKVNAVNAGKEKGYDPEILNRAIYGDIDIGTANPQKSQDLTTGIVKVRRISDGLTKDMSAAKAANIDKTKYEIVK